MAEIASLLRQFAERRVELMETRRERALMPFGALLTGLGGSFTIAGLPVVPTFVRILPLILSGAPVEKVAKDVEAAFRAARRGEEVLPLRKLVRAYVELGAKIPREAAKWRAAFGAAAVLFMRHIWPSPLATALQKTAQVAEHIEEDVLPQAVSDTSSFYDALLTSLSPLGLITKPFLSVVKKPLAWFARVFRRVTQIDRLLEKLKIELLKGIGGIVGGFGSALEKIGLKKLGGYIASIGVLIRGAGVIREREPTVEMGMAVKEALEEVGLLPSPLATAIEASLAGYFLGLTDPILKILEGLKESVFGKKGEEQLDLFKEVKQNISSLFESSKKTEEHVKEGTKSTSFIHRLLKKALSILTLGGLLKTILGTPFKLVGMLARGLGSVLAPVLGVAFKGALIYFLVKYGPDIGKSIGALIGRMLDRLLKSVVSMLKELGSKVFELLGGAIKKLVSFVVNLPDQLSRLLSGEGGVFERVGGFLGELVPYALAAGLTFGTLGRVSRGIRTTYRVARGAMGKIGGMFKREKGGPPTAAPSAPVTPPLTTTPKALTRISGTFGRTLPRVTRVARSVLKGGGLAGLGLAATDLLLPDEGTIGEAKGVLSGALTGAAIGSMIPGVGTLIGAGVGAGLPLLYKLGKKLFGPSQAEATVAPLPIQRVEAIPILGLKDRKDLVNVIKEGVSEGIQDVLLKLTQLQQQARGGGVTLAISLPSPPSKALFAPEGTW